MLEPRSGKLPTIEYAFDPDTETHTARCGCKHGHVSSSSPLVVRRFVQSHIGEHARARIFNPVPDQEP